MPPSFQGKSSTRIEASTARRGMVRTEEQKRLDCVGMIFFCLFLGTLSILAGIVATMITLFCVVQMSALLLIDDFNQPFYLPFSTFQLPPVLKLISILPALAFGLITWALLVRVPWGLCKCDCPCFPDRLLRCNCYHVSWPASILAP